MSTIISVKELRKQFKVRKRYNGFMGSLKTLLSREYKIINAVDGVSFEIEKGEIVGYLGPNGAGKSTTIKMLIGILYPSGGSILVNGMVPFEERRELMRRVGIVFGQRSQLWWDLPVIDSFNLLGKIYSVPTDRLKRNIDFLSGLLEIEGILEIPIHQMSLGQRMRCEIAASLLHEPEILLLDEPSIGLDVVAKEKLRSMIKAINAECKTTILLTTHDLADVEAVCSRILIIDKGKLIYDGTQDEIKRRYGKIRTLEVELAETVGNVDFNPAKVVKQEGRKIWFEFNREELSAADLIARITGQYEVKDLTIHETRLETIISDIYKGAI
ncbi:sugar ABC transporter ATP-binding protein [Anoxybacter fermentans]|uniref:Sugar ABC transporter ATP-binding protein n=1 Tax=Anoxybacter fermentans TaxID=1323375 RepID=A0A3Q9HSP2_9FIRM|nr:ATP-binding cassette domain-containing protein [Anoxybacter fermentans]AZR74355.1 sugar ABC transporter ATP-binding protein [Anoxybacter fermentans]